MRRVKEILREYAYPKIPILYIHTDADFNLIVRNHIS